MQNDLEKDLNVFRIWFPPINLWSRPYQQRFDRIEMNTDLENLTQQMLNFETWVRNQEAFNPDLLMAISKPDDTILFFPVPAKESKGLFLAFEPITDKHALNQLAQQGYTVARCKTWESAKRAILNNC